VRQTLAIPAQVRVWQEDEDPIALIAGALRERGLANGTVGVEETVRFFASDGLAHHAPGLRITSANPVVRGCRMIKTPAEIALMTKAAEVTVAAYRWTMPRVREGMGPRDIGALMNAATVALGRAAIRAGSAGRGCGLSPWFTPAPASARGRGRADGLRLHSAGIPVGHFTHLRPRQGQ
jgi:Xaa-Pro aminopeptidase